MNDQTEGMYHTYTNKHTVNITFSNFYFQISILSFETVLIQISWLLMRPADQDPKKFFSFICFDSLCPCQHFFQACRDGSSWVEPVLSGGQSAVTNKITEGHAQGHNKVIPVRFEPATPQS